MSPVAEAGKTWPQSTIILLYIIVLQLVLTGAKLVLTAAYVQDQVVILQHCSEEQLQQLVQYAYTGQLELAGPAQLGRSGRLACGRRQSARAAARHS